MSASGLALIDKPLGSTSRKATSQVARIFSEKKAGHLGTLDPLATGLLPILLGPATRLAWFLENAEKQYLAKIKLGQATSTMDLEGEVTFSGPIPEINQDQLIELLKKFVGEIEQKPPMYSAVKHQGKRLYDLARKGEEVERKSRVVKIFALELKKFSGDELEILVTCGPGTYIRVLADDLGKILKCGGHLASLRRLKSGGFSLEQAISLSDLTPENCQSHLIRLEEILDFEKLELSDEDGYKIKDGRSIPLKNFELPNPPSGLVRIFSSTCFAIAEVTEIQGELLLKPIKVFGREEINFPARS